jgi:hypothetical protein
MMLTTESRVATTRLTPNQISVLLDVFGGDFSCNRHKGNVLRDIQRLVKENLLESSERLTPLGRLVIEQILGAATVERPVSPLD